MEQYKNIYFISFFILVSELGLVNSYIIYAFVAIWGIYNIKRSKSYDEIVTAFLFLLITSYMRIWQYNERMLFDTSLTFIGILPFINNKRININIKYINSVAICVFLVMNYTKMDSLSMSVIYNALFESNLETESTMLSFIFPFFTLYWLSEKNKKWFLVNLFFVVISGKRISILAVFVSILVICFFSKKKQNIFAYLPYFALLFNITYLFISFMLTSDVFDDFLLEYTGLSSNAFTMGRQDLYSSAFREFDINNFSDLMFGKSSIYELLMKGRLHNDILVLFIENGIVVFVLFWYLFYRRCNLKTLPYLVCLNVLFLTDNTLVYVPVIFFCCFFIRLTRNKSKIIV